MIYSKRFTSDTLMVMWINERGLTGDEILDIIFDEKYRTFVMIYEMLDEADSEYAESDVVSEEVKMPEC